uniref:Uncharacterized protein n=1 Tax=Romanomermis culicivorax TaxID=13658 RepID=A0A915INQ2_ROMCU
MAALKNQMSSFEIILIFICIEIIVVIGLCPLVLDTGIPLYSQAFYIVSEISLFRKQLSHCCSSPHVHVVINIPKQPSIVIRTAPIPVALPYHPTISCAAYCNLHPQLDK